jgi:dTDP-4-amino-4,6-dideoxygalactose transaminase
MFDPWPLGQVPKELQRLELDTLVAMGYRGDDPRVAIDLFEKKVAEFAGAKYGIAVDCCSHGLFLSLKYLNATGTITIPSRTYISVPMQIKHAGCNVAFEDVSWSGVYQLKPYPVWDGAVRWTKGMYKGGFHVVSFQMKKRIPIGKGGMILTDDIDAYRWLKRACHDGRDFDMFYGDMDFDMLGWHYNMTPEDAARGIILMMNTPEVNDDSATDKSYTDVSQFKIFQS